MKLRGAAILLGCQQLRPVGLLGGGHLEMHGDAGQDGGTSNRSQILRDALGHDRTGVAFEDEGFGIVDGGGETPGCLRSAESGDDYAKNARKKKTFEQSNFNSPHFESFGFLV